jgi:hypothetical protein
LELRKITDYKIRRNYHDQPWVMPPGAGPLTGEWREGKDRRGRPKRWWHSEDAVPYARMSAIAKSLDTKEGLVDWAAAQAAVGVMLDASARSEIVTLINEFDADPWWSRLVRLRGSTRPHRRARSSTSSPNSSTPGVNRAWFRTT